MAKNKKLKLAVFGLIVHVFIALGFYLLMSQSDLDAPMVQAWGFIWTPWLISFNAILAVFGAANAIDKKTLSLVQEKPEDES